MGDGEGDGLGVGVGMASGTSDGHGVAKLRPRLELGLLFLCHKTNPPANTANPNTNKKMRIVILHNSLFMIRFVCFWLFPARPFAIGIS